MKHLKLTLILAGLATIGPFTIDTYFPAFPAIGAQFGVTPLQVQQTLSFYLLALAAMMLLHGALADSFGRRRVILATLGFYTVASLGCAFAPTFAYLLSFRVLQGMAAGAGLSVGRAMIRDLFDGAEAQRLMAHVTMLFGVAPAIAPIFGGYLQRWFGWQSIFVFLALFGLLLWLACILGLPETLPFAARQPFRPLVLGQNYLRIVRNSSFLSLALSLGLGYGGFLLYVASASDFVLNVLRLTETDFGWLFIPLVSGLVAGAFVAGRAAGRLEPQRLVFYSYCLLALGAGSNLLYNAFFTAQVPWAVLPLVVYTFGLSLQVPVVTLMVLELFPHNRGVAASLQAFLQTMTFALLSATVVPLIVASGLKHAVAMTVLLLLNVLSWAFYRSRRVAAAPLELTTPPLKTKGKRKRRRARG